MEKIIKGYLILHWRKENMSFRKRKPRSLSPYQIPIRVEMKMTIPETPEYTLNGEIVISETKIKDMLVESLEEKK